MRSSPEQLSSFEFTRRVLIVLALAGLVLLLGFVLARAVQLLLLLFFAVLIAIALHGATSWVCRKTHVAHGWALALNIVLLLVVVGGLGWLVLPQVVNQAQEIAGQLPRWTEEARRYVGQLPGGPRALDRLQEAAGTALSPEMLQRFAGVFSSAFGVLGSAVFVIAVALFIAASPSLYHKGMLALVPPRGRARAGKLLDHLAHTLRAWLLGRLVDMAILTVLTWLGLKLLGIPAALTLALLAGLLSFVPNFGPLISAISAVLLGLIEGPTKALLVAILYVVVQTVESYLLLPLIQKRAVALPPALLLTAQIIFGLLWGVLGLIMATPLTAVLLVLTKELYVDAQPQPDLRQLPFAS